MSFDPRNSTPDGFQVINQGVHSGVAPNTLTRQQLAWAINVTCRGGFPQTRPGWIKRLINFNSDATLTTNFEDALWQGGLAFEYANQLMAKVGGRLFAINLSDWSIADVTPGTGIQQPALRQSWLAEANGFVVAQNGSDAAIIYDGSSSRYADPFGTSGVKEVPTGTVMSYVGGRLWVASPDGRSFVAGDIAFGPTGTQQYARADSVLKFTENDFLNEGGAFGVPLNSGRITAMAPVAQLDTSTGQGPLQVFTERAVFSVNAPADRTSWKNLEYPIQSVSMINSGATGWAGVPLVNGDIWFRSQDGVRSFSVSRRDFGTWANTPQSFELERVLTKDDQNQLGFASGAVFDNRLLMTVAPQLDWDHGTYHLGLAALDLSGITSLGATGVAAWEGVWTGLRILQVISGVFRGVTRCFAFAISSTDKIVLWELGLDTRFDNNGVDDVSISCSIETGSFNWEGGWGLKELQFGEVWYDELDGRATFTSRFRPDQEQCWRPWATWSSCAPLETCLTVDPETGCATAAPLTLKPQYRRRHRFPTPADTIDAITNKPYRHGDEFQVKLEWTGAVRVKKLRLWSTPVPEPAFGAYSTCD